MGRHQQPQIKQRILEACTDYALEHGLPDRLAPLAGAAVSYTHLTLPTICSV